ncbi:MAG: hypothetical protein ACOC55_01890 [Candidatus Natronoplasma sp.]
MSDELEQLQKAHDRLDEEIENKREEIMNLKEQRGKIGRQIDRLQREAET